MTRYNALRYEIDSYLFVESIPLVDRVGQLGESIRMLSAHLKYGIKHRELIGQCTII